MLGKVWERQRWRRAAPHDPVKFDVPASVRSARERTLVMGLSAGFASAGSISSISGIATARRRLALSAFFNTWPALAAVGFNYARI